MLGAALEALLILMVNCYSDDADQTGKAPTMKGKSKPLLEWKFTELLRVAKAANWRPLQFGLNEEWYSGKARIGDYAKGVRKGRNLVHPASYATEHYRSRVTAKYLQWQFDVVLHCRDWLSERNNKTPLEHMKAEGLL